MKIGVLTTTLTGGAGIAAFRSWEALNGEGVHAELLGPGLGNKKFSSKVLTALQATLVQNSSDLITTFSLNKLEQFELDRFDIIHLHAFYNLISVSSLLELTNSKPIFITMHDQRILTGGCHYSDTCLGYLNQCNNCPKVSPVFQNSVRAEKTNTRMLLETRNIHLVSPSKWLADMALTVMNGGLANPVSIIPNPVPDQAFLDVKSLRSFLQLGDRFVIGFISMIPENRNKGLFLLLEAISNLDLEVRSKVILLLVGGEKIPKIPAGIEFRHVDRKTFRSIPNIYPVIDLLAVPSLQDNSPNVIAEALCNGVRIIGSKSGGIPEMLERFSQPSLDVRDVEKFRDAITESVLNYTITSNFMSSARDFFAYQNYSRTMINKYSQALML